MKNLVSAGALAVALGLVSPVVAQTEAPPPTMIGNQSLTEADATRVKVYCEDLSNEANQAEGATNDGVNAPATEEAGGVADTAAVGSVDMSLITLETCVEAGFVTAIGD